MSHESGAEFGEVEHQPLPSWMQNNILAQALWSVMCNLSCIFWHRFWPVGIQSGTNFAISSTCREAAKFVQKTRFLQGFGFGMFLGDFSCFPGSKVVPKTAKFSARLDPDWIPTCQKRCQKNAKLVPTGSRLDPDWIHELGRTRSRTFFPLPGPTFAPIFPCCASRAPTPPPCTKMAKAVLSQTTVLQHINAYHSPSVRT